MRLEYNILWVEDDSSWYETTLQLFKDTLEELGFKLIAKQCKGFDEVKSEIEENYLKDYDLFLVDFTLKGSESGDKIIEFIRQLKEQPILTDVLFYSSAVENVRDSMHELGLEGVYTSDRKDIDTRFELVVSTKIKKIQEVNTMRGLIMAETSDIDSLMLDIADLLLQSKHSEQIGDYITVEMTKTIEFNSSLITAPNGIREKILDGRIFTSSHKAKAINKLCKLDKSIGIERFYDTFDREVMSPRNIFAHVKETKVNGMRVLKSANGKEEIFDEQRCIEIRKTLIRYKDILEQIKTQIQS